MPDTYMDIDELPTDPAGPLVEVTGQPVWPGFTPHPSICMARDPDPKPHAADWCSDGVGHEGLHNWEYCDEEDPAAEYECTHSCRRERGHEPPHRITYEW